MRGRNPFVLDFCGSRSGWAGLRSLALQSIAGIIVFLFIMLCIECLKLLHHFLCFGIQKLRFFFNLICALAIWLVSFLGWGWEETRKYVK